MRYSGAAAGRLCRAFGWLSRSGWAVAVRLQRLLNAIFLAFGAGAMIYVAAHELYPMAHKLGHLGHFAIGVLLALATVAVLQQLIHP